MKLQESCLYCGCFKAIAQFDQCWPEMERMGTDLFSMAAMEHMDKNQGHAWGYVRTGFYGKSIAEYLGERMLEAL